MLRRKVVITVERVAVVVLQKERAINMITAAAEAAFAAP